jgi:HAD superfamily hydrolase (TIGR01549 family)
MSNATIAAILASSPNVLLDFDGPVCSVFGGLSNRDVADNLKSLFNPDLPTEVAETDDPFEVLRHSGTANRGTLEVVERQLKQLEVEAVATAPATPHAADTMEKLVESGHSLTIVSNNSADAIQVFLKLHDLRHLVSGISARTRQDPALLKPNPFLLELAIDSLHTEPGECVLVGDSVSDIQAARSTGTKIISFANKPGKRECFELLRPDAIVSHMSELVYAYSKK